MKWFMHDSRARNDAKLAKIIIKHGIEGYGLYFACIEIIADELTPSNFTFELEHDAELLAAMFRMDTVKVERIMRDFVELGLFEYSETTHRVACYKLAKRLDNATSQNKEVQAILRNFKELKVPSSDLKQIRLDETRLEETREEESKSQQRLRKSCNGMKAKIIERFPLSETVFDLEVDKIVSHYAQRSVGADPACVIWSWFQRVRPVENKPQKKEENLHHGAAYRLAPDLMAEVMGKC